MDLSIIIVNYRGWEKLHKCLSSLASFRQCSFSYEVVIVDNYSNDGAITGFISEFSGFRFIINDINGGFAYGCNIGAMQSTGKKLLFLNPDTVASQEAITLLLEKSMQFPKCLISCNQVDESGRISPAYGPFLSPGKVTGPGRALATLFGKTVTPANPLHPDWISGSVIMTGREFFLSVGGFDEDFWMYFEDMDLCLRARKAGGDVLCFTDFSIEHNHGGSSRINISTTALTKTEVLISKHLYISKHFTPAAGFLAHATVITGNLITGIIATVMAAVFFYIPAVFVQAHIFFRLIGYYVNVAREKTWISRRSVNRALSIKPK